MQPVRDIDPDAVRPLTRRDYEYLVAAGAFEGERVELLYGTVVRTSALSCARYPNAAVRIDSILRPR